MKTIHTTTTIFLSWLAVTNSLAHRSLKNMGLLKLRKWDSGVHLKTEEDMALYLEACLQEAGDDAAFIH